MSILVTGGAGLLGISVLSELTAQGCRAIGYDIDPRPELIECLEEKFAILARGCL